MSILTKCKYLILISAVVFSVMAFATENHCKQVQKLLDNFRINNKIVGMGLFVNSSKLNSSQCYVFSGSIKRGANTNISQRNLFQIGSITKSYFSAILLQLEAESEAGKIPIKFNINQKLKLWLPQYSDWGSVTIKQLLNMTSGIYSYEKVPNFTQMILKNPKKVWTADEVVELAYKHKPNTYFSPGKGWHYSNTGYIIAGQLIQEIYRKATGHQLSLKTILKRRILDKLSLRDTYYYSAGLPESIASRMVHGYGYYTKKDFTLVNLSNAGPAGAIISNPKEIADWIDSLFSGNVLPRKQLEAMQSLVSMKTGQPVKVSETATVPAFSLGLMEKFSKTLGPVWMYKGGTFGYTAFYLYVPKYNLILSVTANVGSFKNNPIQFLRFAIKVLNTVLPN